MGKQLAWLCPWGNKVHQKAPLKLHIYMVYCLVTEAVSLAVTVRLSGNHWKLQEVTDPAK